MASEMRKEVCRLVFETTGVPVKLISANEKIDFEYSAFEPQYDPVYMDKSIISDFRKLLSAKPEHEVVFHWTSEYLMLGAVLCKNSDGFFLLGPVPQLGFYSDVMSTVMNRYHITEKERFSDTIKYKLPYMSSKSFIGACRLLYFFEWKKEPQYTYSMSRSVEESSVYPFFSQYLSTVLFREEDRLQTIPIEKVDLLIQYILNGDSEAVLRFFDNMLVGVDEYAPILTPWVARYLPETPTATDDLKLAQIIFISSVSHISEVLVANGFDKVEAWLVWFYYVEKVLTLTSIKEINVISKAMAMDFSERNCALKQAVSYKTRQCMAYIKAHLNENIDVTRVSKHVRINTRYMSDIFKREVGMSISKYIQNERVSAAKTLLAYTNQDLIEISNILNFSSQSYFTNVFKHITGFTPQTYREKFRKRNASE